MKWTFSDVAHVVQILALLVAMTVFVVRVEGQNDLMRQTFVNHTDSFGHTGAEEAVRGLTRNVDRLLIVTEHTVSDIDEAVIRQSELDVTIQDIRDRLIRLQVLLDSGEADE